MRGKYFTDRDRFLFTVAADEPGQEFPNSAERGKTAHAFRPFTKHGPGRVTPTPYGGVPLEPLLCTRAGSPMH